MVGSPTRALVLGGGGAVGIGWQIGVLTGLRDAGIDLSTANVIVGTSAGALVGALLAAGRDFASAFAGMAALGTSLDADALASGSAALLTAMEQAGFDTDPRQALIRIGHQAQQGHSMDEDTFLSTFETFAGTGWPESFRCTAIDADRGELIVWGPESGVPLQHAVASSCAAPIIFPTVTINGRRYMDGGVRSHLNAAAAPVTDVLVALSCFPLTGVGMASGLAASGAVVAAELAELRQTRRLVALDPDFGDRFAPVNMMDPQAAEPALQLGLQQAAQASALLKEAWDG